ncbi:MAG TPA: tRNA preQ1(34) S-adenosylmethionine ribosyltransferase-isomerase QueA [Acidimicrobiales bacterium]|nr:tRNA preQ1(34) S-adenosylmethionine ribosyltransferase-isomerase QueA [Acidimicrobiales bacterium]
MDVPEYDLPDEAIAQTPAEPRDSARLLDALDPAAPVVHRTVKDLPDLVGPGDVVVVNDSRVIPARLRLVKATGGAAEVLLLDPDPADAGQRTWTALVRPGRRLPPGTPLRPEGEAAEGPVLEVGERLDDDGRRSVRFLADPEQVMARCGQMALPPYIHRPLDRPDRYQTVYAVHPGSVAAPTAGLHLTPEVLRAVQERGAVVHAVDLHVGLATFRPVSTDKAEDHVMHRERYTVPPATWEACREARRVIAVGTTTVRALESAAVTGRLEGSSDLFIRPGFSFSVVDVLLTNFHMPRSTLLLLLEAFAGPHWRELYATALQAGYRFLSFGDAMIVGRA